MLRGCAGKRERRAGRGQGKGRKGKKFRMPHVMKVLCVGTRPHVFRKAKRKSCQLHIRHLSILVFSHCSGAKCPRVSSQKHPKRYKIKMRIAM